MFFCKECGSHERALCRKCHRVLEHHVIAQQMEEIGRLRHRLQQVERRGTYQDKKDRMLASIMSGARKAPRSEIPPAIQQAM